MVKENFPRSLTDLPATKRQMSGMTFTALFDTEGDS